ncbi:DNA cytosine methyltransferase [Pedobacter fastidiosus]|uniref:DNA cytosine methyltransferase n=1 Tax=Pedobacter fastidiosus TaxID=2765361 RepID=A0ABR7KQA4_9SPHI|nr:DNA cytosine methyltransferase [Pedobacter fastidiosus]MBC6110276.1 DNA cytosine methyltransferase [Pedobacter fastidiosus]
MSKYTVGSLYAGVSGICQGFINQDFELSWANEIDKFASVTYRENFKHDLHEGDIWDLNPEGL